MKLDVVKQFSTRSDRVKGIDFHPTEPWILTTLYNGKVEIWSFATNSLVKSIQVSDLPVRSGKFIARKNWIIVGSDDYCIRVYNYHTGEKITQFEAHPDYIRGIAVHPTKSYVLTCSDDLTIKLWNWDNNWKLEQTFEGHQHYVMGVNFNPKDPNTFASACLDRTIKVWSLGSPQPNFTLVAHDAKGVNYVDYYPHADKPYLITSSDDKTIKIWDYQTKSCVATLEGHLANVSFAIFHPELPLIVSGSEDGTVRFWNSNTFRLEKSINYTLERAWCIGILQKSNLIAVGFDSGFVIIKLGNQEPMFSMDSNNKLIYTKNSEVFQSIIKPSASEGLKDGETLTLQQKELGTIEMYPQYISHSPNGKFAAVCGDGEYIIYTALAWRSKSYGKALDFTWNTHDLSSSTSFAIRESQTSVKIFKNLEEALAVDLIYHADKLFGGALLGVKSKGCILFYDWETGKLVRRIDIEGEIQDVVWSENGELLAIVTSSSSSADNTNITAASSNTKKIEETYFLTYSSDAFEEAVANDEVDAEEGVETAFEVLYTLPSAEPILSGKFIGDVFIFTTATTNRLNYFVGGEIINLGHFDHSYYVIGYKAGTEGRLYLIDKSFNVITWYVNSAVLEIQTSVLRGDLEKYATEDGDELDFSRITLEEISEEYPELASDTFSKQELNQLARFFEKIGYLSLSSSLTHDFDSKFQIALTTNNLTQAFELLQQNQKENTGSANAPKWKRLGDLALNKWQIKLAEDCFWLAKDYASLLLLLSSSNNQEGLVRLANECESTGKYNIAWQAWWLNGNKESCFDLLVKSERYSEASIFGVNYSVNPDKLKASIASWKTKLSKINKNKASEQLIDDFSALKISNGVPLIDLEEETVKEEVPAPVEEAVAAEPEVEEEEVEEEKAEEEEEVDDEEDEEFEEASEKVE